MKTELDEKSKLCLEQKHKLDELSLENGNLKEENKNIQSMIDFYESVEKKDNPETEDKEKIKELEINIMNLNEKIKELEEKMIIKENDLEIAKKDLNEQKEIGDKALEMLTEKEEELKGMKEKYEKDESGRKKVKMI